MRSVRQAVPLVLAFFLSGVLCVSQALGPDSDPKERIRLIRESAKKYGEGVPEIAAYIRDPDLSVRLEAALRLADIGGPRTLSPLITLSADPDPEIQLIAVDGLVNIYAILKTEGDLTFTKHLDVARIDFCTFGNSHPFRIRIVNKFNDNYDHYYIKIADASRIYGLELEHILSPNRITFFTFQNTLVEEHIPGIPGDVFIKQYLNAPDSNKIRLAKEFVKFNERCFVRLLGDMRSYNFVVDITPDIEDFQYLNSILTVDNHISDTRQRR